MAVQIRNKDAIIHETLIDIKTNGTQSSTLSIPTSELYKEVPNGGVLIFKIVDVLRKDCTLLDDLAMQKACAKEEAVVAKKVAAEAKEAKISGKRYPYPVPPTPSKPPPTINIDGAIDLERLIFLKPESSVSFAINSDSPAY